jgi:photosystem II stability/assembly factor-like uncharacterized protein
MYDGYWFRQGSTPLRPLARFISVALAFLAVALVLVLGAAPGSASADACWTWRNPVPQGNDLRGITFAGGGSGWAVGDGGSLLRSDDLGASWQLLPTQTGAWLSDVSFGDADHGIAVGERGTVLRTADGGATWEVLVTSAGEEHQAVVMTSASTGWILTTRVDPAVDDPTTADFTSALLRTDDGGATWVEEVSWPGVRLRDLSFATADSGWVVGDDKAVYRTTDAGQSWQPVSAVVTSDSLYSVCARTGDDVWVVGDDDIAHTPDGGQTWSNTSYFTYGSERLTSVAFRDADHGVIGGGYYQEDTADDYRGIILTTADGGASWTSHYEDDPSAGTFTAAAYADDDHLCCVGESAALVHSSDGGATWAGLVPRAWRPLNAVDSVGAFLVAVGFTSDGIEWQPLVARSSDGGSSWKKRALKGVYGVGLNAVDVVTSRIAYAVGDWGTIARTTTQGRRWTTRFSPRGVSQDLLGVAFATRSTGWAVGGRGTILHTTDGRHWARQNSRTREYLLDVAALGSRRALAVGGAGLALRTVNGGKTWRRVRTHTKADLAAVDFVDRLHGWAVGVRWGATHKNVVLRTADGGRTWRSVSVPWVGDDDIVAVDFVTRRQGMVATQCGSVYATRNGGHSWTVELSGLADARGLRMRASGAAWLVGANCAILRRSPLCLK